MHTYWSDERFKKRYEKFSYVQVIKQLKILDLQFVKIKDIFQFADLFPSLNFCLNFSAALSDSDHIIYWIHYFHSTPINSTFLKKSLHSSESTTIKFTKYFAYWTGIFSYYSNENAKCDLPNHQYFQNLSNFLAKGSENRNATAWVQSEHYEYIFKLRVSLNESSSLPMDVFVTIHDLRATASKPVTCVLFLNSWIEDHLSLALSQCAAWASACLLWVRSTTLRVPDYSGSIPTQWGVQGCIRCFIFKASYFASYKICFTLA